MLLYDDALFMVMDLCFSIWIHMLWLRMDDNVCFRSGTQITIVRLFGETRCRWYYMQVWLQGQVICHWRDAPRASFCYSTLIMRNGSGRCEVFKRVFCRSMSCCCCCCSQNPKLGECWFVTPKHVLQKTLQNDVKFNEVWFPRPIRSMNTWPARCSHETYGSSQLQAPIPITYPPSKPTLSNASLLDPSVQEGCKSHPQRIEHRFSSSKPNFGSPNRISLKNSKKHKKTNKSLKKYKKHWKIFKKTQKSYKNTKITLNSQIWEFKA